MEIVNKVCLNRGLQMVFQFACKRIKRIFLFYTQRKPVPKRYSLLSFAGFRSRDIEIRYCISQANTYITVRILGEQIRKITRCKARYCFIRHRSCFSFDHITESEPFKVLKDSDVS